MSDTPERKVKQVILMRRDFVASGDCKQEPHKGKLIAQGAHSAMIDSLHRWQACLEMNAKLKQVCKAITSTSDVDGMLRLMDLVSSLKTKEDLPLSDQIWYFGNFRKIVLAVPTRAEMLEIYQKAEDKGMITQLITDIGLTEFGKPTDTCISIGPHFDEDFIGLTDHLKTY